MTRALTLVLAFLMVVLTAAVSTAQDRPQIVVVNRALQDLTTRLVGDAADVIFPVPAGIDPSFWRPSIANISTVQSADLIILNGAGFASWIDRVTLPRSRLLNSSAAIRDQFIVTESITHSHGDGGEHAHEGLASYTWLDPTLAIAQVEAIAAALVARDLAPSAEVEENRARLIADLTALQATAEQALQAAQGVSLIATHPRYYYLARRFDLAITALDWDAGAVPTEDQLADLAQRAADLDARVLIWEAQPPDAAFVAVQALGLTNVVFDPWASQSNGDDFLAAYAKAVSELADAASQPGSN